MAKLNKTVPRPAEFTHGGAKAVRTPTKVDELRRSVLACLLWEDQFYEQGEDHAARLHRLAEGADPLAVAALAVEARQKHHLRHVPLFLTAVLTRTAAGRPDGLVRKTIASVVQRPDELGEFLAICKKLGMKTLGGQMKK